MLKQLKENICQRVSPRTQSALGQYLILLERGSMMSQECGMRIKQPDQPLQFTLPLLFTSCVTLDMFNSSQPQLFQLQTETLILPTLGLLRELGLPIPDIGNMLSVNTSYDC